MRMVALDLDGTLVDQASAARRWAGECVASLSLDVAVDVLAERLRARRPKDIVFRQLVAEFELSVGHDELWTSYRRRMPELVSCTEDDRHALVALRAAGWRLGIVTNGMSDNQVGKIRALGLDQLVDGWVVSDEVGVRKPGPAIWHVLAGRIGCDLSGWMIGDSLEHDVAGGRAAGLRTAWLGDDPDGSTGADLTVRTVAEAAEFILRAG